MRTHVRIISVIDVILGALTILGGFAVVAASIGALTTTTATTAGTLGTVGFFSGLFVIGVGILGIVVGVKLGELRNWARITQIIYGALQLVNFPVGTIFGVYCLWAMLSEEGRMLFAEQPEKPKEMRRAA